MRILNMQICHSLPHYVVSGSILNDIPFDPIRYLLTNVLRNFTYGCCTNGKLMFITLKLWKKKVHFILIYVQSLSTKPHTREEILVRTDIYISDSCSIISVNSNELFEVSEQVAVLLCLFRILAAPFIFLFLPTLDLPWILPFTE